VPRQPFRRVYPKAAWAFGSKTLSQRPKLAALVGDCIATWSAVELNVALMMALLLRANTEPAIALFSTLRHSRTQQEALLAVANTVLDDERFEVSSVDVALHYAAEYARQEAAAVAIAVGEPIPKPADLADRIFFYKETDLEALLEEMAIFYRISSSLMHHLSRAMDHPADYEELRQICAEPLMQRELLRMRGERSDR
jgi:hypothetical protein